MPLVLIGLEKLSSDAWVGHVSAPRGGSEFKATSLDEALTEIRQLVATFGTPEPPRTKPVVVDSAPPAPADVPPGPGARFLRGERRTDQRTREEVFFADSHGSTEPLRKARGRR